MRTSLILFIVASVIEMSTCAIWRRPWEKRPSYASHVGKKSQDGKRKKWFVSAATRGGDSGTLSVCIQVAIGEWILRNRNFANGIMTTVKQLRYWESTSILTRPRFRRINAIGRNSFQQSTGRRSILVSRISGARIWNVFGRSPVSSRLMNCRKS